MPHRTPPARQITYTKEDLRDVDRLDRVFLQIESALSKLSAPPSGPDLASLANQLAPLIRTELQATGTAPLNLQSLLPSGGLSSIIPGTHADRTALYSPPSAIGLGFYETDRNVLYVSVSSSGSIIWRYAGGMYVAATASVPTDLTANDIGFKFFDTTLVTDYSWNGSEFVTSGGLYETISNATNNAVTTLLILQHLVTAGVGANGIGVGLTLQSEDTDGNIDDVASIEGVLDTATAASETSSLSFKLRSAGAALASFFRVLTTGIRFNVGGFFGILVHANSADRTYTLPNESGTVVLDDTDMTDNVLAIGKGGDKIEPLPDGVGPDNTFLRGNAGAEPTWEAVDLATAQVTGVLPVANGGTNASTAANARTSLDVAQRQTVGGNGAGTYTTITSITVTSEGTISSISGS